MDARDEPAVLIAGPTASGKSALAMELAANHDGVVINADSMQVYAELRILTARPSVADETAFPHRLYGHISAREAYSVARWLDDVAHTIRQVRDSAKLPIIVGGTGLYFMALLEGLSPVPEISDTIRKYWRDQRAHKSPQELHACLAARDPLTASGLKPSDPQRIVRALEVFDATGRPLAEWQRTPGIPLLFDGQWRGIVLAPARADIHARCDQRFDAMMETGALDEVRVLRDMELDADLPAMRAVGVRPLLSYLANEVPLDIAVEAAKAASRQYAKRQLTWLRRNMSAWKWIVL